MTPELGRSLARLRLQQTANLLAWMLEEGTDDQQAMLALDAVRGALAALESPRSKLTSARTGRRESIR